MLQTLYSSLLYTREDGKHEFVHDTYRDFFTAKAVISQIERGELDFAELHRFLGFRGRSSVHERYQKMYRFLRECFGDDYNPPLLDTILSDGQVKSTCDIEDHYGLGKNSRLLIRIKDDSYCNYKGQGAIANLIEHLHLNYGVKLVCIEGADGYIDTSWFKAFPDAEIRKEVAFCFMKKGEITGPEFLSITTDYHIILFGCEDRSMFIKELDLKTKDEDKMTEEDHAEDGKVHKEREIVLVTNTLKAMKAYGQTVAILVYGGGFLYDIDLGPLVQEGVSYVKLNPKERGINWELHKKILRNQRTPLEEILLDTGEDEKKD